MPSNTKPASRLDPVLADQGGRMMASDPADPAHPDPQDRVRQIAYEIYEMRGRKDGHDEDDWFAAESQVKAKGA